MNGVSITYASLYAPNPKTGEWGDYEFDENPEEEINVDMLTPYLECAARQGKLEDVTLTYTLEYYVYPENDFWGEHTDTSDYDQSGATLLYMGHRDDSYIERVVELNKISKELQKPKGENK